MKILITESKLHNIIQQKLDETLKMFKENPQSLTPEFNKNIDKVEKIKVVDIDTENKNELVFDVYVNLFVDNLASIWEEVIMEEIRWIMKQKLPLKVRIHIKNVTNLNQNNN